MKPLKMMVVIVMLLGMLLSFPTVLPVEYQMEQHTIWGLPELDEADGCQIADIDGDGKIDVVASNGQYNDVFWFEQGANTDTWTKHNITINVGSQIQGVDAVDVNGSGEISVFILAQGSDDLFIAHQDTSDPTGSWSTTVLDNVAYEIQSSTIDDVDGDGDYDIIYAYETNPNSGVYWQEYKGGSVMDAGNWDKHLINQTGGAWWVAQNLVDMDDDGDDDVVYGCRGNGVFWAEKPPDPTDEWAETNIGLSGQGCTHVCVGNFSGMGTDKDVGAIGEISGAYWYNYSNAWAETSITLDVEPPAGGDTYEDIKHKTFKRFQADDGRHEFLICLGGGYEHLDLLKWNGTTAQFERVARNDSITMEVYGKCNDKIHEYDIDGDGYFEFITDSVHNDSVDWWDVTGQSPLNGDGEDENISILAINGQANNSLLYDQTPTINWTVANNAVHYILQIDNNIDFSSPEIDLIVNEYRYSSYYDENSTRVSFTIPPENELGYYPDYYIRVRAYS